MVGGDSSHQGPASATRAGLRVVGSEATCNKALRGAAGGQPRPRTARSRAVTKWAGDHLASGCPTMRRAWFTWPTYSTQPASSPMPQSASNRARRACQCSVVSVRYDRLVPRRPLRGWRGWWCLGRTFSVGPHPCGHPGLIRAATPGRTRRGSRIHAATRPPPIRGGRIRATTPLQGRPRRQPPWIGRAVWSGGADPVPVGQPLPADPPRLHLDSTELDELGQGAVDGVDRLLVQTGRPGWCGQASGHRWCCHSAAAPRTGAGRSRRCRHRAPTPGPPRTGPPAPAQPARPSSSARRPVEKQVERARSWWAGRS